MVVLGAAGALTRAGGFQFSDDGLNGICVARDWVGNRTAAERAITLAVSGKVHFRNRNIFALDVAPNINLGPLQQRLHADVFAVRRGGGELPPEFRRLILGVPFNLRIAPREITLLSPGRIFVAPDAGDERVPFVLRHRLLKRDRFPLMCYRHWIVRFVANTASARFQIGRASWRERVWRSGVTGAVDG